MVRRDGQLVTGNVARHEGDSPARWRELDAQFAARRRPRGENIKLLISSGLASEKRRLVCVAGYHNKRFWEAFRLYPGLLSR